MHHKVSRHELATVVAAKMSADPANASHWIKTLAAFLVENHMQQDADLVINDLARALFMESGHLTAEVTSAVTLSIELRRSVSRYLQSQTGATHVSLFETVEPDLIGGFIARTTDAELDASIRRQIRSLTAIA
jgi:F0F1-type ATP synthase delta subunit